jgi:hypothetical protein
MYQKINDVPRDLDRMACSPTISKLLRVLPRISDGAFSSESPQTPLFLKPEILARSH